MFRKLGTEDDLLKSTDGLTVDRFDLGKFVSVQVINSNIEEPIEQVTPVKLETVFDGFAEEAAPDRAFVVKTESALFYLDFHNHVHQRLVFKGTQLSRETSLASGRAYSCGQETCSSTTRRRGGSSSTVSSPDESRTCETSQKKPARSHRVRSMRCVAVVDFERARPTSTSAERGLWPTTRRPRTTSCTSST